MIMTNLIVLETGGSGSVIPAAAPAVLSLNVIVTSKYNIALILKKEKL